VKGKREGMSKAVILLNMGGASSLDEVEVFLTNMFADPNILTMKSSFLRWALGTLIVKTRKNKAKSHYEEIGGKSPLLDITKRLAAKLESKIDARVYIAMRYTPPFARDAIETMIDDDINEIFLLPLYPQYSTTTVKSSIEDFFDIARTMQFNPKSTKITRFYKNRRYNELLAELIVEALDGKPADEYELIFSAHSLPQKIIDGGDSYEDEVEEHKALICDLLYLKGAHFKKTRLAYQSKLGPVKWLGPSLESELEKVATKKAVICPISFTIDNLETVYELDIEFREEAIRLGFKEYIVAKCPNDDDRFVDVLAEIINENGH
jgi:protoporphyrin/coproporphyrin ferrochelatase